MDRNAVRLKSEIVSENRRNTQQVAKTQIKTVHTLPVGSFNSISRFLQSMIADTTLVRNLENPKLPARSCSTANQRWKNASPKSRSIPYEKNYTTP